MDIKLDEFQVGIVLYSCHRMPIPYFCCCYRLSPISSKCPQIILYHTDMNTGMQECALQITAVRLPS